MANNNIYKAWKEALNCLVCLSMNASLDHPKDGDCLFLIRRIKWQIENYEYIEYLM